MPPDSHSALIEDLTRRSGVVMLVGGSDTGKTSFAKRILDAAMRMGRSAAYVDADVDQSVTGPPACAGVRVLASPADLDRLDEAHSLHFVGSISPEGVVLQHVVATAALVDKVRDRVDLVVVDTTGTISGVIGETLKYHKMELCRPDVVVGLQRGAELEPLVGMLRRFFSADVETLPVDPDLRPASPDQRRAHRTKLFAKAFSQPLTRWRVRPTVFAPTLPTGLDLARLDGVLVGLQDGAGATMGLGVLEYGADDVVRVVTNSGEGMRGLRLGSLQLDLDTFEVKRIRLREVMFGLA